MPGKSTHSGEHLPASRSPVLPADTDDIHLYPRYPVTSPRDGNGRQAQGILRSPRADSGRADRKFIPAAAPPPSLLATELLRIEKKLDNLAADAWQWADLPQAWTR